MNRLITIVSKYDTLKVSEGFLKGSRCLWIAPGLTVYVHGPLPGLMYEQACNLALQVCDEMHIPAMSLKRYNVPEAKKSSFETKTRRMF